MKYILLSLCFSGLFLFCSGQNKPVTDTTKKTYTWEGKTLSEKEYRDTFQAFIKRFNDSLRKTIIEKRLSDSIKNKSLHPTSPTNKNLSSSN